MTQWDALTDNERLIALAAYELGRDDGVALCLTLTQPGQGVSDVEVHGRLKAAFKQHFTSYPGSVRASLQREVNSRSDVEKRNVNLCADPGKDFCEVINSVGYLCTRKRGHTGMHAAHGLNNEIPLTTRGMRVDMRDE